MRNGKDDVGELEELLTELEGEGALPSAYSEDDDAVTQLMDAPIADGEWMVQLTPNEQRTLSTEALLLELESGRAGREVLVWRNGMGAWAPAWRVEELAGALRSAALSRRGKDLPPPPAPLPPPPRARAPLGELPPPPTPPTAALSEMGVPVPSMPAAGSFGAPAPKSAPLSSPAVSPVPAQPMFGDPGYAAAEPSFGEKPSSVPLNATLPSFGEMSAPLPPPPAVPSERRSSPSSSSFSAASRTMASAGLGMSEPPPSGSARSNSTRPVAVEFSPVAPPRRSSTQWLVAAGAVALLTVGVTSFALSSAGVFEAGSPGAHEAEVKSAAARPASEPSRPSAAPTPAPAPAKPVASAEPAPSGAAASTKPEREAEADAPAKAEKAEPESAPATDDNKEKETASAANDDEASDSSEERSSSRSSQRRRRGRSRSSSKAEAGETASAKPRARRTQETPAASEAPSTTAEPEPAPEEKVAAGGGGTFNRDAAKAALDGAAAQAKNCRPAGGPNGAGKVQVRYEPSGKVSAVSLLTPEFENTATGDCVSMVFRRARVPAFTGVPAVVLTKSFDIP